MVDIIAISLIVELGIEPIPVTLCPKLHGLALALLNQRSQCPGSRGGESTVLSHTDGVNQHV